MACKIPTGVRKDPWKPDPSLPRRCVAPWHDDEARSLAEIMCSDGCSIAACVLEVEPRRWSATAWDRELTHAEAGAPRRCAIGGWSETDASIVGELCLECWRAGCTMDAEMPGLQHLTFGEMACPGFCLVADPSERG